jgi:hypothetical protein
LIAFAIAIARRDICASAVINRTWAIADATGVVLANAGIDVIAYPILILISDAVASTNPKCVQLIAFAIAIAGRNGCTSTLVNGTRAIANATLIEFPNAVIHIVTNAIGIGI